MSTGKEINLIITTHYLEHKIIKYFGDGKNFGVNIKYIKEKKPLGTAGSLSKIFPNKSNKIMVTNGDVISNINYSEFLNYHNKNNAAATMAVREIKSKHTFGVVASQGLKITNIEEKPITKTYVKQPKMTENALFDGSGCWLHSNLETNEKLS